MALTMPSMRRLYFDTVAGSVSSSIGNLSSYASSRRDRIWSFERSWLLGCTATPTLILGFLKEALYHICETSEKMRRRLQPQRAEQAGSALCPAGACMHAIRMQHFSGFGH